MTNQTLISKIKSHVSKIESLLLELLDQVVVGDELDVSSLSFYVKAPVTSNDTSDESMFTEKLVTKLIRRSDDDLGIDIFLLELEMDKEEFWNFEFLEFDQGVILNLTQAIEFKKCN